LGRQSSSQKQVRLMYIRLAEPELETPG
jgi:hypothetical protein